MSVEPVGQALVLGADLPPRWPFEPDEAQDVTGNAGRISGQLGLADRVRLNTGRIKPFPPGRIVRAHQMDQPLDFIQIKMRSRAGPGRSYWMFWNHTTGEIRMDHLQFAGHFGHAGPHDPGREHPILGPAGGARRAHLAGRAEPAIGRPGDAPPLGPDCSSGCRKYDSGCPATPAGSSHPHSSELPVRGVAQIRYASARITSGLTKSQCQKDWIGPWDVRDTR
jgi:hypothetical protein